MQNMYLFVLILPILEYSLLGIGLMRKCFFIFMCFILVTGCTKKEKEIKTIIEKNNKTCVTINYPITKISKLDQEIKNTVQKRYEDFLEQQKEFLSISKNAEFNMDYTYHEIENRYINITLQSFSNSNLLSTARNDVDTFVYDKNKNSFLTLNDIVAKSEQNKLKKVILKQLQKHYPDCLLIDQVKENLSDFSHIYFTFDEENFWFYFEPYEIAAGYFEIIKISIPVEQIGLTIDISEGKTNKEWKEIETTTKIIDPYKKSIAITFDDGPSRYTNKLLDILKKYDASATFFVIGNKVEIYSDTMRRMVKEGNEIGNHSYNHKWLTKLNEEEFLSQINMTQQIIKKITGFTPRLMRPTYGACNQTLRKRSKLQIVMWDVDTRDWETHNISKILKQTIKNTKDGSIILMHDTKENTVILLEKLLKELKSKDYQFVTVSELEKIKQIKQNEK